MKSILLTACCMLALLCGCEVNESQESEAATQRLTLYYSFKPYLNAKTTVNCAYVENKRTRRMTVLPASTGNAKLNIGCQPDSLCLQLFFSGDSLWKSDPYIESRLYAICFDGTDANDIIGTYPYDIHTYDEDADELISKTVSHYIGFNYHYFKASPCNVITDIQIFAEMDYSSGMSLFGEKEGENVSGHFRLLNIDKYARVPLWEKSTSTGDTVFLDLCMTSEGVFSVPLHDGRSLDDFLACRPICPDGLFLVLKDRPVSLPVEIDSFTVKIIFENGDVVERHISAGIYPIKSLHDTY